MPLCFAYGSNMDAAAMATRCPKSRALGPARLPRHRPALMSEGYLTVVRDPRAVVHGVLWDIALSDMRALDAYEGVERGLYRKFMQGVVRADGKMARALVYIGREGAGAARASKPGYLDGVIAAARAWFLPEAYVRALAQVGQGTPVLIGGVRERIVRPSSVGERDEAGNIKVRPRFASPLDSGRS